MRILTDSIHKIAYSTDASVYREMPLGVAFPVCEKDMVELVEEARRRRVCLIPRAGGTSIAGQVVGRGIVVDVSRYMNSILEINPEERWARVQPGVVRDELNVATRPYGLFFSPETSTSNRCCIGGMLGNNSCGTHSLVYGSTRGRVMEVRAILSDGSVETFRSYTLQELERRFGEKFWLENPDSGSLIRRICTQLVRWAVDGESRKLIERNFPDRALARRSCGYAIDETISDISVNGGVPAGSIDLCRLLSGSEGTLALVTEIKVRLDPLPPADNILVCAHCDDFDKSFDANLVALRHDPFAVELIDGKILELCKSNPEQQRNRFFVDGDPKAIIAAEFSGEAAEANAEAFIKEVTQSSLSYRCPVVRGKDISRVWALRKAGLGVLSAMRGEAKPVGVVEDTAVAPYRLKEYISDFREMLTSLGLDCVYYGHISTGELHLRPILDLKRQRDRELFRQVAEATARLIRLHRGSLSGEHGDGRLRGEFIKIQYGEEVYQMMRSLKRCWDPDNIFNAGKIIDTPPMDEWLRYDVEQKYELDRCLDPKSYYYRWENGYMGAVEQCNGAGECRKSNVIGGTVCPSYKVSGDELRSTRARANVLREILTRGEGGAGSVFKSPEIAEVLDSCLACKGCRSECPSNVDMTRLRSEYLQHKYDLTFTPLRSYAVSRMAQIERLGHLVRPLYNFFATWGPSSAVIKRVVGFSQRRNIPTLSRLSMRELVRRESRAAGKTGGRNGRKVYLFADEFTDIQEASLGLSFARLLIRLGYEVEIPRHVESGRAAFSKGCLSLARKFARRNVQLLSGKVSDEVPLVGIEPSCILSFRDEYPDIVGDDLRPAALELGKRALLYDEFLLREVKAGRISPDSFGQGDSKPLEIWLHGHCHQKSIVGVGASEELLKMIPGATVHVIPSGCCGMAGSFGYEKEHYETSMQIGEMVLFPSVREAVKKGGVVAAPGTSCRQQILDGTGVRAFHPIELL